MDQPKPPIYDEAPYGVIAQFVVTIKGKGILHPRYIQYVLGILKKEYPYWDVDIKPIQARPLLCGDCGTPMKWSDSNEA